MPSLLTSARWRSAACALLLGAAASCGRDAASPESPSIAGSWSGSAYLGAVEFDAEFTQDGENVGGTGAFSSPLGSGPFTITGTVRGRDVQLTLISTEFGVTTFAGRFTGANTIEGTLANPDFDLTIERN